MAVFCGLDNATVCVVTVGAPGGDPGTFGVGGGTRVLRDTKPSKKLSSNNLNVYMELLIHEAIVCKVHLAYIVTGMPLLGGLGVCPKENFQR